ncbi:hypothetical protein RugamoR64_03010 [Duganella rhizosphaerae]|uniref:hypothetical protein n=1 Tax=Duganella rhizosphaerae TaxID=2885763 RepID=UPI0030E8702D
MTGKNSSRFETLGQWHDFWASLLLSAPDNFREYDTQQSKFVRVADQSEALTAAFDTLRSGLHFAERKLKDDALMRIIRELIEMSFEAYCAGEAKIGAHTLQECEGMIWTGRQFPPKYAVEAERRAFGENKRYAGVRISPYPFEGSSNDLGSAQRVLLEMAEKRCRQFFMEKKVFKYFAYVRQNDAVIAEVAAASRKKLLQSLTERAAQHDIDGAVVAELVVSAVNGLIVFNLHQRGHPRVEAISKTNNWAYGDLRFHLNDPTIF